MRNEPSAFELCDSFAPFKMVSADLSLVQGAQQQVFPFG
jgi:hypothetical protein